MKALAVLLYGLGNVSQGMIAKSCSGSATSPSTSGSARPARRRRHPRPRRRVGIVQIDEMWHFVEWKKNKVRVWRVYDPPALRALVGELGLGVMTRPSVDLLDKVGVEGDVFLTDDWGWLPPADPGGAAVHRQGPDLPDPPGQRRRPPPPRPLPPPLQGHRARSYGLDGALRLLCHLRQPQNLLPMRDSSRSLFR